MKQKKKEHELPRANTSLFEWCKCQIKPPQPPSSELAYPSSHMLSAHIVLPRVVSYAQEMQCDGHAATTQLITLLSASSWRRLTAISPGVYTRVGRCQKDKIYLDFTEAIDSEWQWHQLGHMQVCISLKTDKNASTPPLSFYRSDALPAAQPTASKNWRQQWCLLTIFKTVDVYYVRHI